jgi:hypothetical protein
MNIATEALVEEDFAKQLAGYFHYQQQEFC